MSVSSLFANLFTTGGVDLQQLGSPRGMVRDLGWVTEGC